LKNGRRIAENLTNAVVRELVWVLSQATIQGFDDDVDDELESFILRRKNPLFAKTWVNINSTKDAENKTRFYAGRYLFSVQLQS